MHLKKLYIFILVFTLFPILALATSQEEWDLTCRSKTSGTVTLYSISIADDGTKTAQEIGSISAGKYIHVNDFDDDLRMFFISYLANGSRKEAYIHSESAIVQAEKIINFTDGSHIIVPEKVAETPSALQKWINNVAPGRVIAGDGSKPVNIDGTQPLQPDDPSLIYTPSEKEKETVQGDWSGEKELTNKEKEFNAECVWRLQRTVTGYSDAKMSKMYETINLAADDPLR